MGRACGLGWWYARIPEPICRHENILCQWILNCCDSLLVTLDSFSLQKATELDREILNPILVST